MSDSDSDNNQNAPNPLFPNLGNLRPRPIFVTPSPPGGSNIPLPPPPSGGSASSSDWEVVANPNANPINSTIFDTMSPGSTFVNVNVNPNPNSNLNLNFNNNIGTSSSNGNANFFGPSSSFGGVNTFNPSSSSGVVNPFGPSISSFGVGNTFNPNSIPLPASPGNLSSSSSNQDGARRMLFAPPDAPTNQQRRAAIQANRLRVIEGRIRTVFERRYPGFEYRFERVLRAGAAGQTWLLRYQTGNFGSWSRMVLKTPNQGLPQVARSGSVVNVGFGVLQSRGGDMHGDGSPGGGGDGDDDEGEEGWDEDDFGDGDDEDFEDDGDGGGGRVSKRRKNEKRFEKETRAYEASFTPFLFFPFLVVFPLCKLFLNAQHIVNGMFFPQDPMRDIIRTPGSSGFTGPRKGDDWLYLEYLEHGTLLRFVDMCIELQLYQIPNRLAWRFFLCLIRACVGMAYPPSFRMAGASWEVVQPNTTPEDHIHGDMHSGNGQFTHTFLALYALFEV
ncbi:kinase-like protein [Apiospora arundinis]|uniref:Kinase-like protein n=1 Tax=Apiospora arundinis TaxID=335852 RepID=A0ABR2JDT0_9PEZI